MTDERYTTFKKKEIMLYLRSPRNSYANRVLDVHRANCTKMQELCVNRQGKVIDLYFEKKSIQIMCARACKHALNLTQPSSIYDALEIEGTKACFWSAF